MPDWGAGWRVPALCIGKISAGAVCYLRVLLCPGMLAMAVPGVLALLHVWQVAPLWSSG